MSARNPPTCAVIIPCYNGARFLRQTIASLFDQTCPPDEIIVVDDGSTDDSAAIASGIHSRIQVIRQANRGESAARNVGLRAALSNYVVFLDADDLLAPDAIRHLGAAVAGVPGAVAVMSTVSFVDSPETPVERWPTHTAFFPTIIQTNFGPPHCFCLPRELALAVGGFREGLHHSEDWDFWGRIALTGARIVPVDYDGALYRQHPDSQTATRSRLAIVTGRLRVGEMVAAGVLERPALLNEVGEVLFWSLWAMRDQARRNGAPVRELLAADDLLRAIARRGPSRLRRSVLAKTVRYLGVRAADRLRGLFVPA